ncbi:PREDICTED: DNA-directed RNA polymerase II subunit RPB1 [Papilio xuthus]|uniref:Sodium/potassium-transporting ATPase subunit beta-1-interacting protein n=1 Tax=Papilio xuthus TaxID=66420 RepID=A0AAJ7EG99_PAPXU|nr:PREDICTED: DNA-directed RNA polymerase II subunit RPB1 [Papilio xuthus]
MAVCSLRTVLLIVCILELIVTVQRQVFDFLGYMWLPIIANFVNILLIIFGSFGAVQYITRYLLAYAIWSFMWLTWNVFLMCYYLNLGSLNRESGLLSLGTGSVSWWEGNGWGCQPVWGEVEGPGTWRPEHVDGCFLQWHLVELAQSAVAALLTITALPITILLTYRSFKKHKTVSDKSTLPRRPAYTIELSPTETNISESSSKPMTPRRVKRRSGSRGTGSSVRRSRRSYRNAGYLSSNASLPRDARPSRPTSAHSSYSNFHAARPASYHPTEKNTLTRSQDVYDPPPPTESVPIMTNRFNSTRRTAGNIGHDVVGPYNEPRSYEPQRNYETNAPSYDNIGRGYEGAVPTYDSRMDTVSPISESASYGGNDYGAMGYPVEGGWEAPPPPAPPYSARATPQAPGPPAYQPTNDTYNPVP